MVRSAGATTTPSKKVSPYFQSFPPDNTTTFSYPSFALTLTIGCKLLAPPGPRGDPCFATVGMKNRLSNQIFKRLRVIKVRNSGQTLLLKRRVRIHLYRMTHHINVTLLGNLGGPTVLPASQLPIRVLQRRARPIMSLGVHISTLRPVPRRITTNGLGAYLVRRIIRVRGTAHFAVVRQLKLNGGLLRPVLLLKHNNETTFGRRASLRFLTRRANILDTLRTSF